jgi:hypothetical protein
LGCRQEDAQDAVREEQIYFPFSICHFSFVIEENRSMAEVTAEMVNDKWKMENGK